MDETEKSPEYIAEMMGVKPELTMHVDVNSIGVPSAKNWKIDQEVTFTIRGKVKSLSSYEDGVVNACVTVPQKSDDE